MATKPETVTFLCDQIAKAGDITSRKMFGEYAIYCNAKVVALVCDDQFFIKPSSASHLFENECELAPAYPGSKDYLKVPEDRWDDHEWMSMCVRETAEVLPLPKPKKIKE